MIKIDKKTYDEIVQLIMPHMQDTADRTAFVKNAFYGEDNLQNRIPFGGNSSTFSVKLIDEALKYGTLKSGDIAIVAILSELTKQVGSEKGQQISEIIDEIVQQSESKGDDGVATSDDNKGWRNFLSAGWIGVYIGIITIVIAIIALFFAYPGFMLNRQTVRETQTAEAIISQMTPTPPTSDAPLGFRLLRSPDMIAICPIRIQNPSTVNLTFRSQAQNQNYSIAIVAGQTCSCLALADSQNPLDGFCSADDTRIINDAVSDLWRDATITATMNNVVVNGVCGSLGNATRSTCEFER